MSKAECSNKIPVGTAIKELETGYLYTIVDVLPMYNPSGKDYYLYVANSNNATIRVYREEFEIIKKASEPNEKVKEILATEYSEEFNALCKNRVVEGFYKYGPIAVNFGEGFTDAIKDIELCLAKIKETGNTEYFCDIANYAMYGWRYPAKGQSFKASPTEESAGRAGSSYRELEQEGFI